MTKVIRITRHATDDDRQNFLQEVYGVNVEIVTQDIQYGDDHVQAVRDLVSQVGGEVMAVEAIAPFPVLMKLVDAQRKLRVDLIRAQFDRDESGRAIVIGQDDQGRDILQFSHYEKIKRIVFETEPLK